MDAGADDEGEGGTQEQGHGSEDGSDATDHTRSSTEGERPIASNRAGSSAPGTWDRRMGTHCKYQTLAMPSYTTMEEAKEKCVLNGMCRAGPWQGT